MRCGRGPPQGTRASEIRHHDARTTRPAWTRGWPSSVACTKGGQPPPKGTRLVHARPNGALVREEEGIPPNIQSSVTAKDSDVGGIKIRFGKGAVVVELASGGSRGPLGRPTGHSIDKSVGCTVGNRESRVLLVVFGMPRFACGCGVRSSRLRASATCLSEHGTYRRVSLPTRAREQRRLEIGTGLAVRGQSRGLGNWCASLASAVVGTCATTRRRPLVDDE